MPHALYLSMFIVAVPSVAFASDNPPPASSDEIVVYGRGLDLVGAATSGSEGVVGYADFEKRPISRVGELAENVPGLIATQHSGSGKANQYFLRGFNLDHGTDLAAFVDGAPVNMRSHGHGQGYLDLNFLIPELVERIDYAKGPYHTADSDFASAGSMRFSTKSRLARPFIEVTAGSFGYGRGVAAGSTDIGQGSLLAGVDGTVSNGPWALDEKLHKLNALVKYTTPDWSLGLSGYASSWVSTDQVPQRAIDAGLIARNGFIDPDLGGRSGRIALTLNGKTGSTSYSAFAIGSRLQLTSNFTYFLDDPVHGDEFRQIDRRSIFGGAIRHELTSGNLTWHFGADTRWDHIGQVGLYHTEAGTIRATVRQDKVDEYSGGAFGEAQVNPTSHLRLVLGIRADAIGYTVHSNLAANSDSGSAVIASPKAALAWKATDGLEFYANYGEGYHSNDVRGAAIRVDPSSGDVANRVPVLARSRGAELGMRVESGTWNASLVGFWLDLASELVFVGDAGTTEPNAASRRFGSELALFWRPTHALTIDGTAALTRARFRGASPAEAYIPGATPFVLGGGISAAWGQTITTTLRVRHFASAPLIGDNAERSQQTTLVNLGAYWDIGRVRLGLDALNMLNAKAPDITYWYASRLSGEAATGVEDRHIHPVEPRQFRLSFRYSL